LPDFCPHFSNQNNLEIMSTLPKPKADHSATLYRGAVLILTIGCLWPIWALEFPPLQDYPQHLFLAHVNATYANPAANWQQYYLANLTIGPYALFYLLVAGLDKVLSITASGKAVLSLVPIAYGGLALALQTRKDGPPPWATLLLFPLVFHQMYFMGFTNFLLSIPLLIFAILDHQGLTNHPSTARLCRQAILIGLIWLCHPYTVLVYVVLAGANALLALFKSAKPRLALIPPLATTACFLLWYLTCLPTAPGKMPLLWWSWRETIPYYLLMFTGMRWTNGIHWPTLATWGLAAALLIPGAIRGVKTRVRIPAEILLALALTTAGFFVLPFWAGQYSYFNLRLAPISYLFAAILVGSCCPLSLRAGLGLAAVAGVLIAQSATLQGAIAVETAELKPLLDTMRPNATVLPMTFRTDSAVLDGHFFPESHSHDYFYYHLLVGGGASPNLFPSPMLPVHFRPGVDLPKATHDFSWQEHGSKYDYILSRGAPAEFAPFLKRYAPLSGQSGAWLLFKNERKN